LVAWRMKPVMVDGGETAMTTLRQAARRGRPFRIVILDANMPGMDGFTVAERIHGDRDLQGLDLIMLTSGGQRGEAARCREVGISAYLTKPTRRSELLDLIMTVLHPPAAGARRSRLITRHTLREEKRRLSILLVEDNPVNRAVAVRMLERRGHKVTLAHTGREALDLARAHAFQVALMDLQMPEMGGLEATAAIRERERTTGKHLPIVAMTAHAMKGDRERCLAAGMDGYLAKPIQAKDLFDVIDGVLSRNPPEEIAPGPAAAAAVTPPGKVLDPDALMARLDGDTGLLGEIVELFLDSAPRLMRELKKALGARDGASVERAAHTLKGAVANFGAPAALEATIRMERLGHEGDLTGAVRAWTPLEKEMGRLKKALARLAEEHAA